MPNIETLQELLVHELQDLYNAENQIMKALPKMARRATSMPLREAFEAHLAQTEMQAQRLERALSLLDAPVRGRHCDGMQGIIDEGRKLMDEGGSDDVMDAGLIAAAQKVEHYEIAAYGSVKAWAELLGLEEVTTLLEETLSEEEAADRKLSALAESEVNSEAAMDATEDSSEGLTMGPMTQRETVLHGAIIEMLDLEVTLDRALRDQVEKFDSAHPDVVHHLKYVATFTAAHITQLREQGTRNATLAGRLGNAVRRAGSVLSGFSTSAADFLRNATVPEYVRRDYAAACHAYAGYRMLFTTASALREGEICRLAAEFLADYSRITELLQDLLPDAVVTQLESDGLRLEEPAIRRRDSNRIGHLAAHAG